MTRRLSRLAKTWFELPSERAESEAAWNAYKGGDFLDVGAYHGWYSLLLADKAEAGDRFVSFEPDTAAHPILYSNIGDVSRAFPSLTFEVSSAAVGDGSVCQIEWPEDVDGFQHPRYQSAADSSEAVGSEPGRAIRTIRIDDFVSANGMAPSFVKVDVEGAELAVIKGMTETLSKFRPLLMLEIHPAYLPDDVSASDLRGILSSAGYELKYSSGSTSGDNGPPVRELWSPA